MNKEQLPLNPEAFNSSTKRNLESMSEPREKSLYAMAGATFETWLYGVYNQQGANGDFGKELKELANDQMRFLGQHLAEAYNVTSRDITYLAGGLTDQFLPFGGVTAADDWIKARLAEGLYEAGEESVAREVADTSISHSGYREEVEDYFKLKDGNYIRPNHA